MCIRDRLWRVGESAKAPSPAAAFSIPETSIARSGPTRRMAELRIRPKASAPAPVPNPTPRERKSCLLYTSWDSAGVRGFLVCQWALAKARCARTWALARVPIA